jgi:hypothetical protein
LTTRILKQILLSAASAAMPLCVFALAAHCYAQEPTSPAAAKATAPAAPTETAMRGVTVPAKNGVELQATINGQGPFDAVFDTGAGNLMTASLAKRLGLKPEGAVTMEAAGGNVPAQSVKVDKVNIGGLTMSDQWFTIVDLPFAMDKEGIFVGALLVQNLPIRIDFEKEQITFYSKEGFKYSGNGAAVPLHFQENFIVAEGKVDGIAGMFGIDTGDMYSLSLYAPFVAQHNLVRHYGAKFRGYAGEGFGGNDHGFYTRADTLQLGDAEVVRPITILSTDSQGAEAAKTIAGNIGLHILRQFNVVFDFPHGTMYLEKNSSYGKPDIFNRAGLALDYDPEHLKIKTVFPGSPGAKAGLAEEDVITQIDGKPPTDDSIQIAFTQPVGTVLHLTVKRGEKTRTVLVVLKDVL